MNVSTAASPPYASTLFSQIRSMRMGGSAWPKLRNAPDEHMAPNVPVVTTSTSFNAPFFSQLGNDGRHLLGSDDPCGPVTDAFIDLPDGLVHAQIFRFPNI